MDAKLYQLNREITFTLTALNAKESLLTPYLKYQMNVVNDFYVTYEQLVETIDTVTIDQRATKKSVASIIADAAQLLKEISFKVQIDRPEAYKNYFPVNYSVAIRKETKLLKAYAVLRAEINHETIPTLLAFKEQVETTRKTIKEAVNQLTDAQTDYKLLKEEINNLYRDWNIEYKRLKLMIKAVLLDKESSYKIFFSTKKTRKVKDQKEYEPILPASITTSMSK